MQTKPKNDLSGQTFGKLIVKGMTKVPNKKGFYTICDCLNCGKKDVICSVWSLKSGHKGSCGCLARFKFKDITGQKFGYLEIKDIIKEFNPCASKKGRNTYFVICKCYNCGKENFKTLKSSVVSGRTTSCGCRRDFYEKLRGKNSIQFTGYKEISGQKWGRYKTGAKKRNLQFNISIEEAWELYEKQKRKCALTDLPIEFAKTNNSRATASLDRIDSNKDYTIDNIQWVHRDINRMKSDFENQNFINLCCFVAKKYNGS